MVVTLTKQQVARIVAFAGAILPRKTSIPALGHALFEPDGTDRIKVTLTDLEQSLTMRLVPEKLEGAPTHFLFPVAELRPLNSMPNGGTVSCWTAEDMVTSWRVGVGGECRKAPSRGRQRRPGGIGAAGSRPDPPPHPRQP